MTAQIRAARRSDLPAIYELLDIAFGDAPRELFVRQTESDSTFRYRQARIAVDGDRVLAHVRIFARTMLIRGVPVPTGGIGSVASHPDARGDGLPTALLRDCIDEMRREGMAVSFLFTGIPAFYERLGWRIARQPTVVVDGAEAAEIAHQRLYRIRRIRPGDLSQLLRIYREATAGTMGAVLRTARTWRDAQTWLEEDAGGCFVATRNGVQVAYLRSRCRGYGHHILDAEARAGHDEAVVELLAAAGARARDHGERLIAEAPAGHPLETAMRTLPSAFWTMEARYPTMMRVMDLRALVGGLLPQFRHRAKTHPGAPFCLRLRGPDGQSLSVTVGASSARMGEGQPAFALDEAATLDAILGQRRASGLVRPRPPAAIARRIDALLPEAALHFWNSDRI
ncbi:MAG: GNAT family N-acetyltransferase [Dehalococcoidia bacterium]